MQLCADHGLFLASTNFSHKKLHRLTWRPPHSSHRWTQIDHIAIGYRWRGSVQDCRSFWSTAVDSDHALVRARFCLRLTCKRNNGSKSNYFKPSYNGNLTSTFQTELAQRLSSLPPAQDTNAHWKQMKEAITGSIIATNDPAGVPRRNRWISARSTALLDARKTIPPDAAHNATRKSLRRQLTRSLRNDREQWWIAKCREMEKAAAIGNSRNLFRLIRSTGPRKPGVSEVIKESDGALINSQERRLARWAEHFEAQFSWPPSTANLPGTASNTVLEINTDPPSEMEVIREISYLKRHKAAGPDGIPPFVFKDGGIALATELTKLLQSIWDQEEVPRDWCESVIVPIYKKGDRSSCENHRGISLVTIASKLLTGIILRRLSAARERGTRENQAGFRPGRGCIDHIFTLRQILEHRHTSRRPTIFVFLDLKAAFDSVDRLALWRCLSLKGVPEKFINIIRSLYANSRSRVRAYGNVSPEFTTTSGVRQGCPLSPFLFNFVVDTLLENALSSCEDSGIELLPGGKLSDLEYADDIVLLSEDPGKLQALLNCLSNSVGMFGMRFAPSKCKMLLQDWVDSTPNLTLSGEEIEAVDKFCYLGSIISPGGRISDEISSRIQKARLAFSNLAHLWRRRDIRLSVKGRVYAAAVRPVLLYGCETWPLRVVDMERLSVFEHRCLRSIARVWWNNRISNAEVRRRVLGHKGLALRQVIDLHRLRWLGHVLRMSPDRFPRRALFAEAGRDWRRVKGGQSMTWRKGMKTLSSGLCRVGRVRLPGWCSKDPPNRWLETLGEMAGCRTQWRLCISSLTSSV